MKLNAIFMIPLSLLLMRGAWGSPLSEEFFYGFKKELARMQFPIEAPDSYVMSMKIVGTPKDAMLVAESRMKKFEWFRDVPEQSRELYKDRLTNFVCSNPDNQLRKTGKIIDTKAYFEDSRDVTLMMMYIGKDYCYGKLAGL